MDTAKYGDEEDDEEEEEKVEWESRERFKNITVWEHHSLPDAKQEHWIRGIEEWISMAEVVTSPVRKLLICRWPQQDTRLM